MVRTFFIGVSRTISFKKFAGLTVLVSSVVLLSSVALIIAFFVRRVSFAPNNDKVRPFAKGLGTHGC